MCNNLNTKSEVRNPKQIQMTKIPMTKTITDPIGNIAIIALICFKILFHLLVSTV
ncbi:hypothetical protein D1AOALGA4SA_11584 [Olavius algarvensis Delta 1 endosymbiont]|nr:hypothetical protein D1AOALGA4SA_11584 [Olavius algarvensis Delta 1 endosymbiont]